MAACQCIVPWQLRNPESLLMANAISGHVPKARYIIDMTRDLYGIASRQSVSLRDSGWSSDAGCQRSILCSMGVQGESVSVWKNWETRQSMRAVCDRDMVLHSGSQTMLIPRQNLILLRSDIAHLERSCLLNESFADVSLAAATMSSTWMATRFVALLAAQM